MTRVMQDQVVVERFQQFIVEPIMVYTLEYLHP